MVLCVLIIIIFTLMWIIWGRNSNSLYENLPKKGNELKQFYPIADGILGLLRRFEINTENKERKRKIENLNVISEFRESEKLFNLKRISLALIVVVLAAVLGILYFLSESGNSVINDYKIKRPAYGDGPASIQIEANETLLDIEITDRVYTAEEITEIFSNCYELLCNSILGENSDLLNVVTDLNLINHFEGYPITVNWKSSNPQIVDIKGAVNNMEFEENRMEEVVLTATLSYMGYECDYELNVCVKMPQLSETEEFARRLGMLIKSKNEENLYSEEVELPQEMDGKKIIYNESKEDYASLLVLLGIVAAIAIIPGMDKDLSSKYELRNNQMMQDYPEIISKLTILTGAGMSVHKAWERIVKDYEKKCKKRFAYEEMKITYYAMQTGISEANAYSDFGRRCNIHEYLKLGALLEQNVRKGGKGLTKMLEEESIQAFEIRKNLARKLGEEAGTKLLLPMFMMLAIVMVIVMIPAFTSFGV